MNTIRVCHPELSNQHCRHLANAEIAADYAKKPKGVVKPAPPSIRRGRKPKGVVKAVPPISRLRDMPAEVFDKFTADELLALQNERNPSVDTTKSEEEPDGAGGAAVVEERNPSVYTTESEEEPDGAGGASVVQIDLTGSPPAQQAQQDVYINLADATDSD